MKILITSDLFLPSVNGVVTSVLSLARGLERRGHEVKILTLSASLHTHTEGNVICLGSFGAGLLYPGIRFRGICPRKILHTLISWHPDIVHSQCEFSTFPIARAIAKRCGVPLIHTYHTVYENYTHYFSIGTRVGRAMAEWFTRHIVNRADTVIAPTEKIRRLLDSYGVSTPISVIPTGLDFSVTEPPAGRGVRDLRRELGIPSDKKILLFLGRLAKEKNIAELFSLLARPGLCDTVLLLVGDGPYRAELERLVKARQLNGRVFFTGMIPHMQVGDYYRASDIFINPSRSETQGLTYLEAMAAGVPVVCRADPCVEDLIKNGKNGFSCQSTAEMENAIRKLLSDPVLKKAVSDAASATVSASYTSDSFALAAEGLYSAVIARAGYRVTHTNTERNFSS